MTNSNYDSYFTLGGIVLSLWLLKKYFFKPSILRTQFKYLTLENDRQHYEIYKNITNNKARVTIRIDNPETADLLKVQFMYGSGGYYKILDLNNFGLETIDLLPNQTISAIAFSAIPVPMSLKIEFLFGDYTEDNIFV
jgi:hypothetical protein